ncbi:MAG: PQQ-dependent sugar dehydrogenase [bacterium]|nr:PQQ-dependent sugar dehydrogenase [bacterium]
MKKILLVILGMLLIAALGYGVLFYWKNLRGAWFPLSKAPEDITKIINTTGMPLKLPPGFAISIFAKDLVSPRVLAATPDGIIIASITSEGKVVALPDKNGDGVADEVITILSGLNRPHGLAFKCQKNACSLYVAESNWIAMYDYDQNSFKATFKNKITDLPNGGIHFTRTLGFSPDDRLYVSTGSDCNVCDEKDPLRAAIFSMNADGSDFKNVAKGLRNSVFFTWSPFDGKMWATEMGRDLLGDNLPPDEINIISAGKNYGWPICYGKNIHDTDFDPAPEQARYGAGKNACAEFTPSYIDIPAHSAPLGLAFIPKNNLPDEYRYNLLVAYHGSWNRTVPTGYKIVRYKLDAQGRNLGEEDFISGWLSEKGVLGRPVDILIQQNGIIYISDDKAGVIYRVNYENI